VSVAASLKLDLTNTCFHRLKVGATTFRQLAVRSST
jgi:hypothetical protein